MRFMILVKATKVSESGAMPSEEVLAGQLAFHQELSASGALIDATGFHPTARSWRVRNRGGERELIEGPFDEDNLVAGYTLIQVASREEAIEWSMRYPNTALEGEEEGEIEVRQLFDLEDFEQGPAIHGFRELELMSRIAEDVGRNRPDLSAAVAEDGTVTVLFTDIEGSTQLTEALGDDEWMRVLRAHNATVREQVGAQGGFEVKSQGDGFMLVFSSASDALRAAIAIQRALADEGTNEHRLRVRIGLHRGEPIREEDDFYGRAVILAARIAAEARGAEILVSSEVREATEGTNGFSFTEPTDVELKGLSGLHRLSAVHWQR